MLVIDPTARIFPHADMTDSVRRRWIEICAGVAIDLDSMTCRDVEAYAVVGGNPPTIMSRRCRL